MQSCSVSQTITLSNTAVDNPGEISIGKMEELIEGILSEIGEDTSREGPEKTPHRVARAMEFLTSGYGKDIDTCA